MDRLLMVILMVVAEDAVTITYTTNAICANAPFQVLEKTYHSPAKNVKE